MGNWPKWRNGRRDGLKNRWGKPRVGSSPTFGTTAEWCNGSTEVFGAFSRGSNPCSVTKLAWSRHNRREKPARGLVGILGTHAVVGIPCSGPLFGGSQEEGARKFSRLLVLFRTNSVGLAATESRPYQRRSTQGRDSQGSDDDRHQRKGSCFTCATSRSRGSR